MNSISQDNSFPMHLVDEPQEVNDSRDDKSVVSSSSVPIQPSIFRPQEEQEKFAGPFTVIPDQSISKSSVVSFSCDEDGDICIPVESTPTQDSCTPLDYRQDWSIDCRCCHPLEKILRGNEHVQDNSYDLLKCESIASIDMESDCDEDFSSEPVGEWFGNDGIMW